MIYFLGNRINLKISPHLSVLANKWYAPSTPPVPFQAVTLSFAKECGRYRWIASMFILLLEICFSEHLYHNTVWFMHTLQQGRQMNQIFHRMRWPHAFKRNSILRIFVRDKTLPLTESYNPEPMSVQMLNTLQSTDNVLFQSSSRTTSTVYIFLGSKPVTWGTGNFHSSKTKSQLHCIRMWDSKRMQTLFICLYVSTKERLHHLLHSNGIS